MTIFEYLMVLVSIVIGLGMTQALRGLSKIVGSSTRYLPVTLWAVWLMYIFVQSWWALWDLSAVATWNQLYFTMIVLMACAMFGATELLLPMGASRETDWRAHFFEVRRWFFAMLLAFTLIATIHTRALLGVPLTHPYRIMQASMLAVEFVGMVSADPRLQQWLPVLAIFLVVASQVLFRLLPGLA